MRQLLHIDTSGLSNRQLTRFLAFVGKHNGQPIDQLIKVWNKFAKNVDQYVFVSKLRI
jgi:hypothetical protein